MPIWGQLYGASKKDYLGASIYRLIFLHDKTNILADPHLFRDLPLIGASNWTVVIISSRGRTGHLIESTARYVPHQISATATFPVLPLTHVTGKRPSRLDTLVAV
jgi:hypothetical protein